jgi:parallel beta-helix repeat protein
MNKPKHPRPAPALARRQAAVLGLLCCLGLAPAAHAGLIYATDFGTTGNPWTAWTSSATSGVVTNRYYASGSGTIDSRTSSGSGCIVMSADTRALGANAAWSLTTRSGPVARQNANTETNLAKLTLGVDLHGNRQGAVTVRISSLNSANAVTGTLETTFELARWSTWQRFTADLSTFTPVSGTFNPEAPAFEYSFVIGQSLGWPGAQEHNILRVDNLTLAAPSFYVRAGSTVSNPTGRSESSPFTNLQAAVNAATAGDVIHIMDPINNATYQTSFRHATITKAGGPAAWIVIRSNPGHNPVLNSSGWSQITLNHPAAYIEVRDLTFRGNRANVTLADAVANRNAASASGTFNGDGLHADGRVNEIPDGFDAEGNQLYRANPDKGVHHVRFIRNVVFDHCGGGINATHADYVTIEDNVVYSNANYSRYANSGISVFRSWKWDASTGVKNFILRNESRGNRSYVPWINTGTISDGNGIIIDDNTNTQRGASGVAYTGRTLVANNLVYGNGGSGIHTFRSSFVDIFHNTAYNNNQSPELNYGQIYAGARSTDVNIANNVWWAQANKRVTLVAESNSTGIAYRHNLVFGDGNNNVNNSGAAVSGTVDVSDTSTTNLVRSGNAWGAPGFLNPSLAASVADFRLAASSPAVDSTTYTANGVPKRDLDGVPRPLGASLDRGALEGGHHSRQAEVFSQSSGCTLETSIWGFSGTGYINFGNQGSFVEWTNFNVPTAGTYRLVFRYINGSSFDRPATVWVNNTDRGTLAFPFTGSWNTWDLIALDVPLNAGNNTLRLTTSTTSGGPIVDRLDAARR